jgi:uncharacterized SAM-binding protein YcdF (DUF218 family)
VRYSPRARVFFFLSKTLDELATPLVWAMALALLGAWAARKKRRRLALAAPLSAAVVLYLFSVEPVANFLLRSAEAPARGAPPPALDASAPYDAVIVLGGLVDERASPGPDYTDAIDRLLAGYDLLRTGRARYALLSGGRGRDEPAEAESLLLARQLEGWGVSADRLVVEDRSRNTRENAVEAARIVQERGWTRLLLVTSAFHMKRAAGCFRAVGLRFEVLPVDFRGYDPARFSGSWLPRADRLADSTFVLREYLGRVVYRARGDALAWP